MWRFRDVDGYLIRTDPFGYPLWSRLYFETAVAGNPHYSEWLNAVAEAQPVQGQNVGDILAVGGQEGSYGNWRDGLAVRVSGTNGGFTAPLHTMALHNLPTDGSLVRTTELWAIRELQQGSQNPDLVMVGTNAAWLGASEGYAVKTGPNLNNVLVEHLIGDGVVGGDDEGFTDAVEIAPPSGYANPGIWRSPALRRPAPAATSSCSRWTSTPCCPFQAPAACWGITEEEMSGGPPCPRSRPIQGSDAMRVSISTESTRATPEESAISRTCT